MSTQSVAAAVEPVVPTPGRPRIVAAAVVQRRRWKVVPLLGDVVAAGGRGLLITADGARTQDLPDGVETLDLVETERSMGLHRLITRAPLRPIKRRLGRDVSGPSWAGPGGAPPSRTG